MISCALRSIIYQLMCCQKTNEGEGRWNRETWQRGTIRYCKCGHRETSFSVRIDAHYKFIFVSWSIIWAAHRFLCFFSSISICFSYSYARQTKLASSLVNVWAHYKIVRSQHSSEVVAAAAVAHSDALKLSLLARAPTCPRLRHRSCCCCCCCCRSAAVGTPYERLQNGWLHAETTGDCMRRCRIVTKMI